MFDFRNTEIQTWKEYIKYQGMRFDEILEVWIFILDYFVATAFCLIPVSLGFDFFAFAR